MNMDSSHPSRTVGIIQARMGSTRLPGKVLKTLAGRPLLAWVVSRARNADTLDEVVVATSNHVRDDAIEAWAEEQDVLLVRGSEDDVLDRYYQAASRFEANVVVRLTADNPLVGGAIIDQVAETFKTHAVDYAAAKPGPEYGFPYGVAVEVFSMGALAQAWKAAEKASYREHVTPYFYRRGSPFRTHLLQHSGGFGSLRLTVDTESDYQLMQQVFAHVPKENFKWTEVAALVARHSSWKKINAGVKQKQFYD